MKRILVGLTAIGWCAGAQAGSITATADTYTPATLPATVTLPDIQIAFTLPADANNFWVAQNIYMYTDGGVPVAPADIPAIPTVDCSIVAPEYLWLSYVGLAPVPPSTPSSVFFRVTQTVPFPFPASGVVCTFHGIQVTGASLQASGQVSVRYELRQSFLGGVPDEVIDVSAVPVVVARYVATRSVDIDIKPGTMPNTINMRSLGNVPVAILSSSTFYAPTDVNVSSLSFGRMGDEQSLLKCDLNGEDVNLDGLVDLVCHFNSQVTGFQPGDTQGVLKGETTAGQKIKGTDSVSIPCSNLPIPKVSLTGTEPGGSYTRYVLSVTNASQYPDGLFAPAPNLPACGLNTNASRTWVYIDDPSGNSLNTFCALHKAADMQGIWFAVPQGSPPPTSVSVVLTDRQCNVEARSRPVAIP